jgi:hypothetical protein
MFVLHHCDNPPCINPDHLYIGTKKDNTQDMTARGRDRGRFQPLPLVDKICPVCGSAFQVKDGKSPQNLTCSPSCAAKHSWITAPVRNQRRADPQTRTCPICQEPFTVTRPSSRKKTCGSVACVSAQRWAVRRAPSTSACRQP